jgi:hypothetical protein
VEDIDREVDKYCAAFGDLPQHATARLYWRLLQQDSPNGCTVVEEDTVTVIMTLRDIAVAAGVKPPDASLLLNVRSRNQTAHESARSGALTCLPAARPPVRRCVQRWCCATCAQARPWMRARTASPTRVAP